MTILESLARCQGVPSPRANHVCLLYDYGCDQEGLYLVLKVGPVIFSVLVFECTCCEIKS